MGSVLPACLAARKVVVYCEGGECEDADSVAIMLRDVGIPSRLVNGFRSGEFNDVTSQYVIRASNAHSWVEAYFPGHGWVSFDPTPGGVITPPTGWGRVALYVDAMRSFWREWVVNYDVSHQQTLGEQAARNTRHRFFAMKRWYQRYYMGLLERARKIHGSVAGSPARWALISVLAAGMIGLLAKARRLSMWIRRRRLARHPGDSPAIAAALWYERMTHTLARRGWRKSPLQTPQEFLNSIDQPELRQRLERFTWHYHGARFGELADDAQQLPDLYEEVSEASRK